MWRFLTISIIYGTFLKIEAAEDKLNVVTDWGVLTAPDFDNDGRYDNDQRWEYRVKVHDNRRIIYTFTHMDIEESDICEFDGVAVTDSKFVQGVFCGDYIPPKLASNTNKLTIAFYSDSVETFTGFNLTWYSITESVCAFVKTRPIGELGYPDQYSSQRTDSTDCTWTLISPYPNKGDLKQIYVTHLDIEEADDCKLDFLQIYDEDDLRAQVYCGEVQPPMFTSRARVVFIDFVVFTKSKARSFSVVYAMTGKDEACGGIVTEAEGLIKSPDRNSDGRYEDKEHMCVWAVVAPLGHRIELDFHHFDLEDAAFCAFDFVEIYDGSYTARGAKLRYCGSRTPPVYRSTENKVFLLFQTDDRITYTGFNITFRQINQFEFTTIDIID